LSRKSGIYLPVEGTDNVSLDSVVIQNCHLNFKFSKKKLYEWHGRPQCTSTLHGHLPHQDADDEEFFMPMM
jgi:hypothetical protein